MTYVYQAGIDPQRLADEPGHLITAATVKRAIEQGGRAVDFLRGDEPYKAHFRALARPLLALRGRTQPHAAATAEQPLAGRPQRETLAEFTRRIAPRTTRKRWPIAGDTENIPIRSRDHT